RIMQGAQMRLYNLIVSSRQGSCPCRTRANTFKIVQDLPGQGEKSTCCLSALHADRDEQLSGRFHQGKNVAGSQSGCGAIQELFSSPDVDRRSSERSHNLPGGAPCDDISFHSEYLSLQRRHTNSAESLQRMHAANRCTALFQGRKRPRILGPAG